MAAPAHQDPPPDSILAVHDHFDPPRGLRAEVIGGNIVLSPTPAGEHNFIYDELHTQLRDLMPRDLAVTNTTTVDLPATDERFIPDVLVISKKVLYSNKWLFAASEVELACEIVSPASARDDRETKVRGYASSGVPIYLLVDPLKRTATLFSDPAGDSYQTMIRVRFGGKLVLPNPYEGAIDTALFELR